jgi:ketosteroid isomerase-like protein
LVIIEVIGYGADEFLQSSLFSAILTENNRICESAYPLKFVFLNYMQELIERFYTAFASGDSETMASCYHPEIHFTDEVFVDLKGPEVMSMWRMLLERSNGNLLITHTNVYAGDQDGVADWTAVYLFSATKRKVTNHIHARFQFRDGKIYRHVDTFDLSRWASQALGWRGWVFGKWGFFRKKLQHSARKTLLRYMEKKKGDV